MTDKRGQITAFIIIGIIIVASIALVLTIREKTSIFQPKTVEPENIGPVKRYIENCLHKIGKEGVIELGQKGGYIRLPTDVYYDPSANIELGNSVMRIPLWYYMGEDRIPTIEDMEEELVYYIDENLDRCLNNLTDLNEAFVIEEKSAEKNTKVMIAEEDVAVDLEYALIVTKRDGDQKTEYSEFSAKLPVRLKRVHELAVEIMNAENRQGWFESVTIDLMSANPDIPISGMDLSCSRKIWYESTVKEELSRSLAAIIPAIRFKNTDHPPFLNPEEDYLRFAGISVEDFHDGNIPSEEPPEDAYEYFHYYWDFTEKDFSDIGVGLSYYPEWGIYLNARPSSAGGLMKSGQQRGDQQYLRYLCIQLYQFVYDIRYPILISVRDGHSFDDGYIFRFGFPTMIQSNNPDRRIFAPKPEKFTTGSEELCSTFSEKTVTVYAKERFTDFLVKDVNISYRCFDYVCPLGKTRAEGGDCCSLTTNVPEFCINGIMEAESADHFIGEGVYGDQEELSLIVTPAREYTFKVLVHSTNDLEYAEEMDNDETAILQLSLKSNYTDYEKFIQYPYEDNQTKIRLVYGPAVYDLDLMLIKGDDMIGGYRGEWEADYYELKDKDNITFHLVRQWPTPQTEEDQIMMIDFLYNNETYLELLKPTFE